MRQTTRKKRDKPKKKKKGSRKPSEATLPVVQVAGL